MQIEPNTVKKIDNYVFSLMSDELGAGSFGKVYRGKHEKTNEVVAVKMVDKRKIMNDEYLLEGIKQEISTMKKLKSPNIVQLIDVFETSNNYYIICEFCGQGDLRGLLKKSKKLPEEQAKHILVDLLHGFLELIRNGVIHRDLKPENILIHNNVYKLADFGFAKTVDNFSKQVLQSAVGTPLYMSPQILKSEKYSTKCDIWSLGNIYYELLYGVTPWPCSSLYELITKVMNNQVKFPSSPAVSEESKDFIRQCLEVNEEKRIAWSQIFQQKLVKDFFQDYIVKAADMESKANFIINMLRQHIYTNKVDLEKLFQSLAITEQSKLKIQEFSKLMLNINQNLQREEIEYIFNKFDDNGDCVIDFSEFTKWLSQNSIRITQQPQTVQPNNNNKRNTIFAQADTRSLQESKYIKEQNAIKRLLQVIKKFNIDLKLLFNKFDSSKNNSLEIDEFGQMIKKIDSSLNDEEIKDIFLSFDEEHEEHISFSQFITSLSKLSGDPSYLTQFSQQYLSNQGSGDVQQRQPVQQPQQQQQCYNNPQYQQQSQANQYLGQQVPYQQQMASNQMNQTNQTNQTNQMNQMNQTNQMYQMQQHQGYMVQNQPQYNQNNSYQGANYNPNNKGSSY